jgi:hypothetical protein
MVAVAVVASAVSLVADGAHAARARRGAKVAPRRAAAKPAARLRPVPLPDGSGQMRLPAGWKITGANSGMVSAEGPEGNVDLGIWFQVYTPQAAAMLYARPPIVAPYTEPARAIRVVAEQVWAVSARQGMPRGRWVRLIDQKPTPWANGKAAFVHFEYEIAGHGRFQSVALAAMMPLGDGSWIAYSSSVAAPSARFARSLPVLQEIWASWKVSDHVFRQRLTNALNSMKETHRIYQQVNRDRQDAQDRSNRAWSHVIRETWVYEDRETGRRYEVPHAQLRAHIERKNRAAGYERYHEVPYRDLNR